MLYQITRPKGLRTAQQADQLQARIDKELGRCVGSDMKFLKDCGIAEPVFETRKITKDGQDFIEIRLQEE